MTINVFDQIAFCTVFRTLPYSSYDHCVQFAVFVTNHEFVTPMVTQWCKFLNAFLIKAIQNILYHNMNASGPLLLSQFSLLSGTPRRSASVT